MDNITLCTLKNMRRLLSDKDRWYKGAFRNDGQVCEALAEYNDDPTTTHEDILALLDRAIEHVRK